MTNRRYRGARSFPIPVWNGIFDHRAKIETAIWVFLWCLDRVTREEAGVGFVLGGSVVTADRIAGELAYSEHTVRDHLNLLAGGGYIELKRAAHGFVITVANSAKFGIWRSSKFDDHDRQKTDDHSQKTDDHIREGFDSAVDSAKRHKPRSANFDDHNSKSQATAEAKPSTNGDMTPDEMEWFLDWKTKDAARIAKAGGGPS